MPYLLEACVLLIISISAAIGAVSFLCYLIGWPLPFTL